MTSAATFKRMGVKFVCEDGQHFIEARSELIEQAVVAEIEKRASLIMPHLPFQKVEVPQIVRIGEREAKRWGECMVCIEKLLPHVSGTCELCDAAMRMALRKLGLDAAIPRPEPRAEPQETVSDVYDQSGYVKPPWEKRTFDWDGYKQKVVEARKRAEDGVVIVWGGFARVAEGMQGRKKRVER